MKMGNEHIFEDLVYPNYVPAPNGGAEDAISGSTRSPLGAVTCLHYIYIYISFSIFFFSTFLVPPHQ
uniref:Uncharacterized protein n=1 Tax=Picea glauca TaxID=3330 RepID=A0A101LUE1_PICGL|nr:hypothetical protein ABT39_MTgene2639 [Picea glauca]QHR88102.1 hypothetical protein Q903MT_gene2115 [Picea sitchensis]